MIRCSFCQSTHVDNTIFCSECGNYLLAGDERPTDPLGNHEIIWRGGAIREVEKVRPLERGTGPMTVRLKIGEHQREIQVVLNQVIHIGRLDPASNMFPEVDLTADDAHIQGVSRRHAGIFKQGAAVVVEDLGSINGTFINGKRLDPYIPEPLADGDLLQLGRLLIKVKLREH